MKPRYPSSTDRPERIVSQPVGRDLPPSSFTNLPVYIPGEHVNLETFTPLNWLSVQAMTANERLEISAMLGMKTVGAGEFARADAYEYICHIARAIEAESAVPGYSPQRYYWMINRNEERVVGITTVVVAPSDEKVLAIGYRVLAGHRRLGYASDAARAVSDAILKRGAALLVCAEALPTNTPSIRALLNAGFQQMGEGVCSLPSQLTNETVRRFLKTGQNIGNPPKWPVCVRA